MTHVEHPYAILCFARNAGISTADRVAIFDQETRDIIGDYNAFEIETYGYEFPG